MPRQRVQLAVPVEELAARYRAGEKLRPLGIAAGVGTSTVRARLIAHGVQMRVGARPRVADIAKCLELRARGMSLKAIGAQVGCSTVAVWAALQTHKTRGCPDLPGGASAAGDTLAPAPDGGTRLSRPMAVASLRASASDVHTSDNRREDRNAGSQVRAAR